MRRLALALAALALTCGCADSSFSTDGKGFVSGDGKVSVLDAAERTVPSGEVTGETIDGETVSLADYSGSIVVMPVWGSWCSPCRAEAPMFAKAARELRADGVQFLGIDSRDLDLAAAKAFVADFGVDYSNIYDPDGRVLLAFRGTLPPQTIPSVVFIDEDGRVAARVLDTLTRTTLDTVIQEIRDRSA